MEGKLKEIVTFLEGNFAEKKEIGRKPYVPKVEALASTRMSHMTITCDKHVRLNTTQNHIGILCKIMHDCMLDVESFLPVIRAIP